MKLIAPLIGVVVSVIGVQQTNADNDNFPIKPIYPAALCHNRNAEKSISLRSDTLQQLTFAWGTSPATIGVGLAEMASSIVNRSGWQASHGLEMLVKGSAEALFIPGIYLVEEELKDVDKLNQFFVALETNNYKDSAFAEIFNKRHSSFDNISQSEFATIFANANLCPFYEYNPDLSFNDELYAIHRIKEHKYPEISYYDLQNVVQNPVDFQFLIDHGALQQKFRFPYGHVQTKAELGGDQLFTEAGSFIKNLQQYGSAESPSHIKTLLLPNVKSLTNDDIAAVLAIFPKLQELLAPNLHLNDVQADMLAKHPLAHLELASKPHVVKTRYLRIAPKKKGVIFAPYNGWGLTGDI